MLSRNYIIYIILLFSLLFPFSYNSLAEDMMPYELEAEVISYDYQQGKVMALNGFVFAIEDLIIRGEEVSIDFFEGLIQARGDVLLDREGEQIKGEFLEYNYLENKGMFVAAKSEFGGLSFSGGKIKMVSTENYHVKVEDAIFTTCQIENPHYHLRAGKLMIYRDGRILARDVTLFWGEIGFLHLPTYLFEYVEQNGKKKIKSSLPLPVISYNSKSGLNINLDYNYGINDMKGKVSFNYEQAGAREIKNQLNYRWTDIYLNGYISMDLNDFSRREGFALDYHLTDRLTFQFEQEWEMEKAKRFRGTVYYNKDSVRLGLDYKNGHDIGRLPYLYVQGPLYSSEPLKLKAKLGIGRIKEEKIMVEKGDLLISSDYSIEPWAGWKFNVNSEYHNHYYLKPGNNYQSVHVVLKGDYEKKINEVWTTSLNIGYDYKNGWGKALLPADEVSLQQLLNSGVKVKYFLDEVGASWEIGVQSLHSLEKSGIKEAELEVRRNFDCHSYSFFYDLLNKTFGFGFEF